MACVPPAWQLPRDIGDELFRWGISELSPIDRSQLKFEGPRWHWTTSPAANSKTLHWHGEVATPEECSTYVDEPTDEQNRGLQFNGGTTQLAWIGIWNLCEPFRIRVTLSGKFHPLQSASIGFLTPCSVVGYSFSCLVDGAAIQFSSDGFARGGVIASDAGGLADPCDTIEGSCCGIVDFSQNQFWSPTGSRTLIQGGTQPGITFDSSIPGYPVMVVVVVQSETIARASDGTFASPAAQSDFYVDAVIEIVDPDDVCGDSDPGAGAACAVYGATDPPNPGGGPPFPVPPPGPPDVKPCFCGCQIDGLLVTISGLTSKFCSDEADTDCGELLPTLSYLWANMNGSYELNYQATDELGDTDVYIINLGRKFTGTEEAPDGEISEAGILVYEDDRTLCPEASGTYRIRSWLRAIEVISLTCTDSSWSAEVLPFYQQLFEFFTDLGGGIIGITLVWNSSGPQLSEEKPGAWLVSGSTAAGCGVSLSGSKTDHMKCPFPDGTDDPNTAAIEVEGSNTTCPD